MGLHIQWLFSSWCLCSSSVHSYPIDEAITAGQENQSSSNSSSQIIVFVVSLVLLHVAALVSFIMCIYTQHTADIIVGSLHPLCIMDHNDVHVFSLTILLFEF